ncbi:MAG: GNAT family N-acetyltransferase [Anaerolineae bacterium]|nr:GNAT family N-acetyltransferase [Anaerolineae bacterium]
MVTIRHTPTDHGTKIELLVDAQVASGLEIWDLTMRVGPVGFRCGGIGGVFTQRPYRMRGYARRVLEDSIAFMRQEGYVLSALFGIPNFYTKFGFASALVNSTVTVKVRHVEGVKPRYAVRPLREEDIRAVAEIYEALNARRTGTAVRDPATWKGFRRGTNWSSRFDAFVVLDGERIVGYGQYNLDPWNFGIGEIGYRDPSVFSTLLAEATRLAWERRLEEFSFYLPLDDPFVEYCCRYGCEIKITYPHNGGGMVRVIDQQALFVGLEPLWRERLEGYAGDWGSLSIVTDLGEGRIPLGTAGPTLRVEMPQPVFTQLLMGYRRVQDVLEEPGVQIAEEAIPLLDRLFPRGYPYMYVADRF